MAELWTSSVGSLYVIIELDGFGATKFPCTRVDYTMTVNEIPLVTVEINAGASIKNPGLIYNPEGLLIELASRDTKSVSHGMLVCSVWEEATDQYGFVADQQVFAGYVTGGTALYRAGEPSMMQVRLDCLGWAAALQTAPGCAYVDVYQSELASRLVMRTNTAIVGSNASASGNSYAVGCIGYDQLLNTFGVGIAMSQAPISRRMAISVAACKEAMAFRPGKVFKNVTPDADVERALGGQTCVKRSNAVDHRCDKEYSKELLKHLMETMTQSTIWENLKSFANSNQIMLDIVPRWSCDAPMDFKMDVSPCNAWSPNALDTLIDSRFVSSLTFPHNSIASINMPDVLLVHFNSMSSFGVGGQPTHAVGITGVAAKDKNMQDKLRSMIEARSTDGLAEMLEPCRVMEIEAPRWIDKIITACTHHKSVDGRTGIATSATRTKVADELSITEENNDQPSVDSTPGDEGGLLSTTANTIAEALFTYYYMRGSKIEVTLNPACRFGLGGVLLENMLNGNVTIDLRNSKTNDYGLCLHGVLNSVRYQYTSSGQSTNASYVIELDRAYIDGAVVPKIECPIYE